MVLERLLILLLPFMFFHAAVGRLHLAAADFAFPVLAAAVLLRRPSTAAMGAGQPFIVFAIVSGGLMTLSMTVTSLSDPRFVFGIAVSDAVKLLIGLAYAFVFAVAVFDRTPEETHSLLRLWGWTATAMAAATVATDLTPFALVPTDGFRSLGFFQDANLYAGYLLISLVVVIAVEAIQRTPWTLVQVGLLAGGVILTASRGALVTLVVAAIVGALMVSRGRIRIVLLGLGVAAGAFFGALRSGLLAATGIPAIDRLQSSTLSIGDDPRLALWTRALELWEEHPFLGVGIGQYRRFSADAYRELASGYGYIAHNTFLSFLAEMGVVGLALCVVPLSLLVWKVYSTESLPRPLRNAFVIGMAVIAMEMMVLNFQTLRFVWVFIGIAWAMACWPRGIDAFRGTHPERPDRLPYAKDRASL